MLYNYQEAINLFGSDYLLKKAIRRKKFYKIEKGIYSDKKSNFTSYELIMKKYGSAFLVKDSALFYLGFVDVEPSIVHIGTARNALRIKDKRVKQHFYSRFEQPTLECKYGYEIDHILCCTNVVTHITDNQNEVRLFNLKALLFDLIRDSKCYRREDLISLLLKFKDCAVFTDFCYSNFEDNMMNENILWDGELDDLIEKIDVSALSRKCEREWERELDSL